MNKSGYIYGVVRVPFSRDQDLGTGVGEPPAEVRLVAYREIGAAISTVDAVVPPGGQVRGLRRDMSAHAAVLNRLMQLTTVLPARFGYSVGSREALEEVLRGHYQFFDEQLTRLAGAVELALHIRYREDQVLRELYEERMAVAGKRSHWQRLAYDDQIAQGQRIAMELQAKRDLEARALLEQLSRFAREVSVSTPPTDMTVLKASFLVDKHAVERMDRIMERIYDPMEKRMELEYVGPLPPYSFTSLQPSLNGASSEFDT
jgi:hypothetical protein